MTETEKDEITKWDWTEAGMVQEKYGEWVCCEEVSKLERELQRSRELLDDYIRDKRVVGEALGLKGESVMILEQQLREIDNLQQNG